MLTAPSRILTCKKIAQFHYPTKANTSRNKYVYKIKNNNFFCSLLHHQRAMEVVCFRTYVHTCHLWNCKMFNLIVSFIALNATSLLPNKKKVLIFPQIWVYRTNNKIVGLISTCERKFMQTHRCALLVYSAKQQQAC